MLCPHCNSEIEDKAIAAHMGSKGGKQGRRTLTSEQARVLQLRSARARKKANRAKRRADMEVERTKQAYREAAKRVYGELIDMEIAPDADVKIYTTEERGALVTIRVWVPEEDLNAEL